MTTESKDKLFESLIELFKDLAKDWTPDDIPRLILMERINKSLLTILSRIPTGRAIELSKKISPDVFRLDAIPLDRLKEIAMLCYTVEELLEPDDGIELLIMREA